MSKDNNYSANQLQALVSNNLKVIISQNGTTQKELADKIGVAPATMSDYCKGHRLPSVDFLFSLKSLYDISIDDFITKDISIPSTSSELNNATFSGMQEIYSKLVGTYFIYYLDTGKYKGRDNRVPSDSLTYGILSIYKTSTAFDAVEYGCVAALGMRSREEARCLKNNIDYFEDTTDIVDYFSKNYQSTFYSGGVDITQEHIFISLSHSNTDKSLVILHRVDNNKDNYLGGIGTVNSVSKGRERMPVVQYVGLSRYPLEMSDEEVHHALLLSYPEIEVGEDSDDLIREFKALFSDENEKTQAFSEQQKSVFFRSILSRYIRKSVERNVFRYGKVSNKDDDDWYHLIKQQIPKSK